MSDNIVGPEIYSERNDDIDTEGYRDLMEFRLVYQGALPGSGNSSRHAPEKHHIRKQFHLQLSDLWARHPLLKRFQGMFEQPKDGSYFPHGTFIERFGRQAHGLTFLALVNEELDQVCALDILLLRRERPGGLITQGGDVDNRIKTLFDALSIPESGSGVTPPEANEYPFYCVMQKDKLVTQVGVTADRLLIPTSPHEPQNYVHAIIDVKIQVASFFKWGAWEYVPYG